MWKICPCSCSETQKTSLRMTYDAYIISAVLKTRVHLLHEKSKTIVRFLRELHVESGSLSPNTILRDIYDWHVKRSFALRYLYSLNHFKYAQPRLPRLVESETTAICNWCLYHDMFNKAKWISKLIKKYHSFINK